MNTALLEPREKHLQLAVAHQGVATHQGEVDRLLAIDDGEDAADQVVAFVIGQLAQVHPAGAQMFRLVRVTTGAPQGALAGDFDGECWLLASENAGPGVQHFRFLHSGSSGEMKPAIPMILNYRFEEWSFRPGLERWIASGAACDSGSRLSGR